MIGIEEGRSEGLKREGVTKFAHSLLAANIVGDNKSALEFAESIGTFAEDFHDIETEGKEVKASLNAEDGKLQVSFSPESIKLSFSNKAGVQTYEANSPVEKVQLRGPFLRFKLRDGGSVRAVKQYETISIDHFAFDLYDLK